MNNAYEKEKAVRYVAKLEDFDGTVQEWKNAVYEIWRYQMGYSFAYSIELVDLYARGKSNVKLYITCKKAYANNTLDDTLKDLGFRNVEKRDITVARVYPYDILSDKDTDTIDEITIEW